MERGRRDRLTIELRGLRERLQTLAAARQVTAAALVRQVLVAGLDDKWRGVDSRHDSNAMPIGNQVVKVTLRIPVAHAKLLAVRARAAEVSQGVYVAAVLEGTPPAPRTPDHDRAVAALIGSTYQLAALSADINAHLRAWRQGVTGDFEEYRMSAAPVLAAVRQHLQLASQVVATLSRAHRFRKPSAAIRRSTGKAA